MYGLWTEDAMKRNVSITLASGLFRVPYTTLQNGIEDFRLQQKLQNFTFGET
jgi:hypothetical protein